MSYQVLARKWRPQVFQDVVGQEHITQTLTNAITNGRLAHAYLFGGPRGIGKTSVARILAKAVNCKQGAPGTPCNQCRSCMEITDGSSTDVQEIDGASNRGIEEIRALRENVKYMPSSSDYRIYIIDEVHMLTIHAFNALLKTLEEPPAHVKFIFATTETHKVPVTILSRCQRFDFKKIPPALIVSHLENIIKQENLEISRNGLTLIAKQADGCMRDAQSLLDQVISFSGQKAEEHHIREILGLIDRNIVFDACRAILENSPIKCFEIIDRVYHFGHDMREFYRVLIEQFRDLLLMALGASDQLLETNESNKEEAMVLARQAGSERIHMIMNFLLSRERELRYGLDPRLMIEATMVKLCSLGDYLSFGDLLEKINNLEKKLINAGPATEPTETEQVSDPPAAWVPGASEEFKKKIELENAPHYDHSEKYKDWDGLLNFVKSKSQPVYRVLKDWILLSLNQETLEIAKKNDMPQFSAEFFNNKDRLDQLTTYCRDFFERDIRIIIRGPENAAQDHGSGPTMDRQEPLKEPSSPVSKAVQDLVRVFQGELHSEGIQKK